MSRTSREAYRDVVGPWQAANSHLVRWSIFYARPGRHDPERQDIEAAIALALRWREIDGILEGLRRDVFAFDSERFSIILQLRRSWTIEALDLLLEQGTGRPRVQRTGPVDASIAQWFEEHLGQADSLGAVPWGFFRRFASWYRTEIREQSLTVPPETDLGGLTLRDALDHYSSLLALSDFFAHLYTDARLQGHGCCAHAVQHVDQDAWRYFGSEAKC